MVFGNVLTNKIAALKPRKGKFFLLVEEIEAKEAISEYNKWVVMEEVS